VRQSKHGDGAVPGRYAGSADQSSSTRRLFRRMSPRHDLRYWDLVTPIEPDEIADRRVPSGRLRDRRDRHPRAAGRCQRARSPPARHDQHARFLAHEGSAVGVHGGLRGTGAGKVRPAARLPGSDLGAITKCSTARRLASRAKGCIGSPGCRSGGLPTAPDKAE
jgi:hypothetical protein